jgi:hypothetical protein
MNKKGDFKNIRLQAFLSRRANMVMTLHPVKREWRIAMISLGFIKILTMVFSLFAGFGFFSKHFDNALQDFTFFGVAGQQVIIIFSVITLATIELLTAVFLEKMFKFFYRHRFITATLSFLIVGVFYSLSFISSTNGLAERQAAKKDKTVEINTDAEKTVKEQKAELDNKLADYNGQIAIINNNPQGWSGGRRTHLTAKQLKDISLIEEKKEAAQVDFEKKQSETKGQMKLLLGQNDIATAKTAKDYYKFMSVIMVIQIFATMILIFFYHLVRAEEQRDALVSEDLKEISETVANHAETLIFNTLIETSNRINFAVQEKISANKYLDAQNIILNKSDNPQPKPGNSESEKTTVIGFSNQLKNEKIDFLKSSKTTEPSKRFDTSDDSENKIFDFLRKHKKLVSSIKKINPDPKNSISNSEIRQVQAVSKEALWRSNTTIQKVYVAMQTVGFERIDDNGNIK